MKLSDVQAHECALWFCVQAHYANVSFGVTEHKVTAHWNQAQKAEDFYDTLNLTNIPEEFKVTPGVKYSVAERSRLASWEGLKLLLYGIVSSVDTGEVAVVNSDDSPIDGLKGLWYAAHDIDSWMRNLTLSLSNNVRLTGKTAQLDDAQYNGVAWTQEVYIKVQWAWIVFPWALVLLSLFFLVLTIVQNRKTDPWKNSSSAILYTRLEQDLHDDAATNLASNRGLTEGIDQRTVRLDTENWTFYPTSKAA